MIYFLEQNMAMTLYSFGNTVHPKRLIATMLVVLAGMLCAPVTTYAQSVPLPPSNLIVIAVGNDAVDLSWQDNSDNELRFVVSRSDDEGAFRVLARVDRNLTSFEDRNSNLQPEIEYCYQVRGENVEGASSPVEACLTIPPRPNTPTNVQVNQVGSNSIVQIRWQDHASNETGYRIFRILDGGTETRIGTVPADRTRFNDLDVRIDGEYCYTVAAFNPSGESSRSDQNCASVTIEAPSLPQNIQARALSGAEIELMWQLPVFNYAVLHIERAPSTDGPWTEIGQLTLPSDTFQDGDLDPNTQYCYRTQAENIRGLSDFSAPVCATTEFVVPDAPADVRIEGADVQSVNVSWTAPNLAEHRYRVDRRIGTDGNFNRIADDLTETTFTDTGLDPLAVYCYRVQTFNPQFESEFSDVTCGFPQPEAVINLTAVAASDAPTEALIATWAPGGDANNLSYVISFRETGTETWSEPLSTGETSFRLTNLNDATRYDVRVQSIRTRDGAQSVSTETIVGSQTFLNFWPGDTNGDGTVNGNDVVTLTSDTCFGATTPFSTDGSSVAFVQQAVDFGDFDPAVVRCDGDQNGSVEIFDFLAIAANAGQSTGTDQAPQQTAITSAAHRARVQSLYDGFTPRTPAQTELKAQLAAVLNAETASTEIPAAVTLASNYPNPFQAVTHLVYGIPEAQPVHLTLYNTLGQPIKMLVDDMREAGWHTVELDATALPAGTYFLVLNTSTITQSRTLTHIK